MTALYVRSHRAGVGRRRAVYRSRRPVARLAGVVAATVAAVVIALASFTAGAVLVFVVEGW